MIPLGAKGPATFTVATNNDNADEANGSVSATVNSGTGYTVASGQANRAAVAVNDNDQAIVISPPPPPPSPPPPNLPRVSLPASPNPVVEGEAATVTATLSRVMASDVTIPLALTACTAEARDYEPLASITIVANEPNRSGEIAILQDDGADDETFTVALGRACLRDSRRARSNALHLRCRGVRRNPPTAQDGGPKKNLQGLDIVRALLYVEVS